MLERGGLLLCPWQVHSEDLGRSRLVLDLHTRQRLGAVRPRASAGCGWAWFRRVQFEVVETEDDSLLLTLLAPWRCWVLPSCWEILDADDLFVCGFRRRELFDGSGRVRALLFQGDTPDRHLFLSPDNRLLATTIFTSEGDQLLFTEAIENDPYARMAVLGAVLALRGSPTS